MSRNISIIVALTIALITAPAHALSVEAYIYTKCLGTYGSLKAKEKARYYAPLITAKAKEHAINPLLLASLVWHESNYNPRCVSPAGALGLGQVMPFHFKSHGYDLSKWADPQVNLELTCRLYRGYYRRMAQAYPELPHRAVQHRALVAYNMGPRAVVSRGIHRSRYSKAVLKEVK